MHRSRCWRSSAAAAWICPDFHIGASCCRRVPTCLPVVRGLTRQCQDYRQTRPAGHPGPSKCRQGHCSNRCPSAGNRPIPGRFAVQPSFRRTKVLPSSRRLSGDAMEISWSLRALYEKELASRPFTLTRVGLVFRWYATTADARYGPATGAALVRIGLRCAGLAAQSRRVAGSRRSWMLRCVLRLVLVLVDVVLFHG